MHSKIFLAFAACLLFAFAGCAGGAALLAGAAAIAPTARYNDAVAYSNRAVEAMEAAGETAKSRVEAARRSPTQSSIAAAHSANNAFFQASQTSLNAERRVQSLAPARLSASQRDVIANNIRVAMAHLDLAREWNGELNALQQSIGGGPGTQLGSGTGSGGGNINLPPPDWLDSTLYSYEVTSGGAISTHLIEDVSSDPDDDSRRYTDGRGNQVLISLDRTGDITTWTADFSNGSVSSSYRSLGTTNGISRHINLHDHDRDTETHRHLLIVGSYGAARLDGEYYNPPSSGFGGRHIHALHYGDISGLPRGDATFRGAMIGTELTTHAALQGKATITYSLSDDNVDIRLHDITQYRDGAVTAGTYGGPDEIRFDNADVITITYANVYSRRRSRASGIFYGPGLDAQETAGEFEYYYDEDDHDPSVIGAWYAKQQ